MEGLRGKGEREVESMPLLILCDGECKETPLLAFCDGVATVQI